MSVGGEGEEEDDCGSGRDGGRVAGDDNEAEIPNEVTGGRGARKRRQKRRRNEEGSDDEGSGDATISSCAMMKARAARRRRQNRRCRDEGSGGASMKLAAA